MTYTTLGSTGLDVSELCLGTMNFGSAEPWMLNDEAESRRILERALDLGINFFDTANAYSNGESERILARPSTRSPRRRSGIEGVLDMHDGPNGSGLSKKLIIDQCHATLDRVGVDYLDLYQIHRWDDDTPIEETLDALTSRRRGAGPLPRRDTMADWKFRRRCTLRISRGMSGSSRCNRSQRLSTVTRRRTSCRRRVEGSVSFRGRRWPAASSPGSTTATTTYRGAGESGRVIANRLSDDHSAVLDEVQSIAEIRTNAGTGHLGMLMPKTSSTDYRLRLCNFALSTLIYNLWRLTDYLIKVALDELRYRHRGRLRGRTIHDFDR